MKQIFKSKKKTKPVTGTGGSSAEPAEDDQTAPASGSGSSSPAGRSKAYPITLEISSLVVGLTKDISEFSSALGPLKAACGAVSRVLDVLKVRWEI